MKGEFSSSWDCHPRAKSINEMIQNIPLNSTETLKEPKFRSNKLMNNDMILKLYECNFLKESNQVCNCGSRICFSNQEHIETKETRLKLKSADFCKFRFCATCNWRRNMNISRELLEAFEFIEANKKVSYLFLTLTIKNPATEDLKATVKLMNEAFKRMSETKAYKNTILGHFKSLEIVGDETPAGEVHPHFHVLLIVNSSYFSGKYYISQAKWTEMWQKALRVDYTPVVDVRRIKPKTKKDGTTLTALQSAVFEVAKYSVKHTILTSKSNEEFTSIINQTKGMRFFSTGGLLKEKINLLKCDEELINFKAETNALWKEIEELIYIWRNGDYRLKEIKRIKEKEESKEEIIFEEEEKEIENITNSKISNLDENNLFIVLLKKLEWSSKPKKLTFEDFQYHFNEFCKMSNKKEEFNVSKRRRPRKPDS